MQSNIEQIFYAMPGQGMSIIIIIYADINNLKTNTGATEI